MAYNYTNVEDPQTFDDLVGDKIMNIIASILFVLTLGASIYGVTSWCIIKKFRHFKNYVVLSAVIAKLMIYFFYILLHAVLLTEELVRNPIVRVISLGLILYWTLSFHFWLIVLCYIFYAEFVKVFHLGIRRRYLKSTLFAWVLPFILNLVVAIPSYFFDFKSIRELYFLLFAIYFMPLAINFVIYILVLYCLFRPSKAGASASLHKWRRFYVATLTFVLSNVIYLMALMKASSFKTLVIDVICEFGDYLNTIALVVYLIILKSNRELWREFLNKRANQKALEMK